MLDFLLPDKVSDNVRAEQIRLVHHQGVTIQALGVITAIISVVMFWNVADQFILLSWFVIMVLLTAIRIMATVAFNKKVITDFLVIRKWGHAYVLGTFLSGIVWGSLAFVFDPSWPAPYQVILFVLYTGISAGAFNTNTPYFIAYPAFYLPPVLCLVYVMLKQTDEGFAELGGLFLIYIVLMYVSAIKFHNRLAHSLSLRFENEQLANELAESNRQLAHLADKDELTNLHNRRSMDKYLHSEWNRHLRSQQPLSLLFLDIDYFKQFNDTYGHEGGDQALVEVSRVLENNVKRSIDMAARFGGEEFAVILPETGEQNALTMAENIRNELAQLRIPHESSTVAPYLTVSIGVVTVVPHLPDNDALLRTIADEALYTAKEEGRNRVIKGMVP